MMKIKGCDIHSEYFKEFADDLFFMFNGTYKGISVNNTFKRKSPGDIGMWTDYLCTSNENVQQLCLIINNEFSTRSCLCVFSK